MSITEWIVLGVLAGFSVYDLKWKKVVVWAVLLSGVFVLVYRIVSGAGISELLAGLVPGLVLLLVSRCTRESIGIGDGLVLCVLGLFCGLRQVLAVLGMALVLSAALAMVLLVLKKAGRKTELPFLPCLFAGYLLCVLW